MTQVYLGILIDESRTDAMTQPSQDLIKGFYAKGGETIQQAIARACVAWADNKEHAQRLYDSGSMGDFMWSSPMFANAPLAKWTEWQDINSFLPIYDNEDKFEHPGAQNISCFESETPIRTDKGLKRIADIQIGDMVMTHTGQYKKVLNTKQSQSVDCYELEFQGERHTVTGNHLILTKAHGWVRVDELRPDLHEIVHIPQSV